jgi:hypothetical protein
MEHPEENVAGRGTERQREESREQEAQIAPFREVIAILHLRLRTNIWLCAVASI